jgi:hypothetical protein
MGVAALCTLLTACGQEHSQKKVDTFDVYGQLTGNTTQVYENRDCVFPRATFRVGDQVVVRGAANQILATGTLRATGNVHMVGTPGFCDMRFDVKNIPTGEAAYQVSVGSSGPVVVTEDKLRCKGTTVFSSASAFDILSGHTDVLASNGCVTGRLPEVGG